MSSVTCSSIGNPPDQARRNILYIMTDQQRYDSLGLTGRSICRTPHLDRLAASGTHFSNAYSVCALCSPARASMLTGLYPHNHKMLINNDTHASSHDELGDRVRLISQDLVEAGYACGYAGKWHCGTSKVPSTYGFRGMDVPAYGNPYKIPEYRDYLARRHLEAPQVIEYVPEIGRTQARFTGRCGTYDGPPDACEPFFITEYSLDLLRELARQRREDGTPFMLFVSFWAPHHACFVPEPYASLYDPAAVELWPNFDDDLANRPAAHRKYRDSVYPLGQTLDRDTWKRMIAKYWGFCSFVDDQIGRLVSALDDLQVADSTAVLFSTDHGDTAGCHGRLWDKGPFMYEDTYHIPLLARVPWLGTPGRTCDRLVTNMDLATTALDIAGVKPRNRHDGRSLLPLVRDPGAEWPDDLMCEYHGNRFICTLRMLRWGRYKYIFNATDCDELYDLEADPAELVNRIADPALAEVAERCRRRLAKRIRESGDLIELWAEDLLNAKGAIVGLGRP